MPKPFRHIVLDRLVELCHMSIKAGDTEMADWTLSLASDIHNETHYGGEEQGHGLALLQAQIMEMPGYGDIDHESLHAPCSTDEPEEV